MKIYEKKLYPASMKARVNVRGLRLKLMKIDPLSLPCYNWKFKTKILNPFPKEPGIYFIFSGDEISYIGSTVNLYARLGAHPACAEAVNLNPEKDVFVRWLPCFRESKVEPDDIRLLTLEDHYIKKYRPCLNKTFIFED